MQIIHPKTEVLNRTEILEITFVSVSNTSAQDLLESLVGMLKRLDIAEFQIQIVQTSGWSVCPASSSPSCSTSGTGGQKYKFPSANSNFKADPIRWLQPIALKLWNPWAKVQF